MDIIFICILAFLIILACFDLVAGVSNDAVNFLNSAIGAKAAPFKVILGVSKAHFRSQLITSDEILCVKFFYS